MTYNPAKHNRHSIRLKGYDYAQSGLYFITICCHNRACIFGHIENGIMIMNQYGKIAHNHLKNTIEIRNNIELHEFVVMPNHIHGIIQISRRGVSHTPHTYNEMGLTDNMPTNDYHSSSLYGVSHTPHTYNEMGLTNNIPKNDFHSSSLQGVSHTPHTYNEMGLTDNIPTNDYHSSSLHGVSHTPHTHNEMGLTNNIPTNDFHSSSLHGVCDTPLRSPSQTIGAIIRGYKSSVTKQLKLMGYNDTIWQRNYHEHIIRNEQSYIHISNYIIHNPANWDKDVLL